MRYGIVMFSFHFFLISPKKCHLLMYGVSQKSYKQNVEGNIGRLDFWTAWGHPGYLGLFRPIWAIWATVVVTLVYSGPKIWSLHIALKILFAIAICNFFETLRILNKLRHWDVGVCVCNPCCVFPICNSLVPAIQPTCQPPWWIFSFNQQDRTQCLKGKIEY